MFRIASCRGVAVLCCALFLPMGRLDAAAPVLVSAASSTAASTAASTTLPAFASEAEFEALLSHWRAQARAREIERRARRADDLASMQALPAPAPAAKASAGMAQESAAADESITNVQTAGVDEGGIVKRHGDFLVILRRGRLFTVRVGGDMLQPVAAADAFGPGIDPSRTWYDELLVSDGTVVVIGYSYARGGTEVGLFDLDREGGLHHRSTHQLRSNDYYSSRNYASRLIGRTLIFYSPMMLSPGRLGSAQPSAQLLPAQRRWQGDAAAPFRRILPAERIYRGADDLDPFAGVTLHTVTRCDLAASPLRCESSAVLGPGGRVFYVSAHAVYVWTHPVDRRADRPPPATVFRLPLDGSAPSALRARGAPIDALSFLEDEQGHLNVLLRSSGRGEGMWGAETGGEGRGGSGSRFALMRVRLDAFGDGSAMADASAYREMPTPSGGRIQNRFVGDWLIYGAADAASVPAGASDDGRASVDAVAVRFAGTELRRLSLGHRIERIERLGTDALLIGRGSSGPAMREHGDALQWTPLRLGDRAEPMPGFSLPGMAQAESRTHGFFYREASPGRGLLGLPIRPVARRDAAPMAVRFFSVDSLKLASLGALSASSGAMSPQRADGCRASCVDWYGNARPLFLGNRVIALMGYELVEGSLEGGAIRERRRIDFTPSPEWRWGP